MMGGVTGAYMVSGFRYATLGLCALLFGWAVDLFRKGWKLRA